MLFKYSRSNSPLQKRHTNRIGKIFFCINPGTQNFLVDDGARAKDDITLNIFCLPGYVHVCGASYVFTLCV